VDLAREGDALAQVVDPRDPGHGAFHPQAEARVGHRAVTAQVEEPLVGFLGQAVLLQAAFERLEVHPARAAADDLAVALGGDEVGVEHALGVVGVGFHVERLHRGGVLFDEHGPLEVLADGLFLGRAEVLAHAHAQAVFLDELLNF